MKIDSCSPFLDEIILGFNPENADMGNPNGTIYGKALFIAAVTPSGRRFVHHVDFDENEEDRASRFAAKVLARSEIDLEYWNETFEVYGSSAWCAADAERAAAWAMDPNTSGTVRDI
jgi:hypothetical protein